MSDRCTITMPEDCYAAVLDAVQRAVIDKCASKATRKAAFSALSALVEPGEISIGSAARDMSAPGKRGSSRAHFPRRYRFTFRSR
jgi:hypothetical protein